MTNAKKSISQSLLRETLYQSLVSDANRLPKCTATAVFFFYIQKGSYSAVSRDGPDEYA